MMQHKAWLEGRVFAWGVAMFFAVQPAHAQLADVSASLAATAPLVGNVAGAEKPPTATVEPAKPPVPAAVIPPPVINSPAKAPAATVRVPAYSANTQHSVFFSDDERAAIVMARKQYQESLLIPVDESDLIAQIKQIEAKPKPKPPAPEPEKYYAQFYVRTIIYHTPNDWTLWVTEEDTNKKYTPDVVIPATAPLKILSISKEDAKFEWHPRNWEYVTTTYKGDDPNIRLDSTKQSVIFVLRVNQTMAAKTMTITEGTLPLSPMAPKEGASPAPAVPGQKPAPAPAAPATPAARVQPKEPAILDLYKNIDSIDKKL